MKLSDAAVLGDSLRKRDPGVYITKTHNGHCGCAIGGAILAIGGNNVEDYPTLFPWLLDRPSKRYWNSYANIISTKFYEVMYGTVTFEALIAYIKSVEPGCGTCNRFKCSCKPAEVLIPIEQERNVLEAATSRP